MARTRSLIWLTSVFLEFKASDVALIRSTSDILEVEGAMFCAESLKNVTPRGYLVRRKKDGDQGRGNHPLRDLWYEA